MKYCLTSKGNSAILLIQFNDSRIARTMTRKLEGEGRVNPQNGDFGDFGVIRDYGAKPV